jgi:tetratricopeptide (TPR) repeat protein
MKRPQLISQGSLNRILTGADEAWARGDFQQCLDLLERASRLNPSNFNILLRLGQAYGFRYDRAAAERCFDKAIRVAPNKADVMATAGRLSADVNSSEMAGRYLEGAVQQKDATSETFAKLAEFYERLHRLEDAAKMVERALHLDAACPLAWFIRAKLDRQAGRLDEAALALRPSLLSTDRDTRVRGCYELGAVFDRQGRYDEAMTAFHEAKALLQPDAPPRFTELQFIIHHLNQMQNEISAGTLERWTDSGREFLQPFHRLALLSGHARSGTTLLEQVLDSHPSIVSAEETKHFNEEAYSPLRRSLPPDAPMLSGLEVAQPDALRRSRINYFRSMELHLDSPIGDRLLIDKNPGIHYFIPAFIRIFPETKFLIALRDPRDVVLSCFMQSYLPLSTANVTYLNLESTVERYTRVMGMWQTLKPLIKNPWLEVRYEDMVEDLESVARKTLEFLGVPWDDRVLGFDEHARKKMVRTPTYSDVTQKIYKRARGRWRNYQKYLEPHLEALAPFARAFGYE